MRIFVTTHLFLNGSKGLPSSQQCISLIVIVFVQFKVQ
jgi:hypothetical protein